jgi:hypothetical protein
MVTMPLDLASAISRAAFTRDTLSIVAISFCLLCDVIEPGRPDHHVVFGLIAVAHANSPCLFRIICSSGDQKYFPFDFLCIA